MDVVLKTRIEHTSVNRQTQPSYNTGLDDSYQKQNTTKMVNLIYPSKLENVD